MDLTGRVAVVTGASRGLGRAIALRLPDAGAAVVVAARTAADLEVLVAEIHAAGGQALAVVADVSDESQAERLIARAAEAFDHLIDILVNNPGSTFLAAIAHIDTGAW